MVQSGSAEGRVRQTPLPLCTLAVLLPGILSDSLALAVVFPFLPFMVQHLMQFPPQEQYKIGYYQGMLGGAYSCGQIVSAPFWGKMADRCGRRPVVLYCLFGSAVCMSLFGLASSFWLALAVRFCHGLVNGTSTAARVALGDITDSSNVTRAFALVGIVFGAGDITGPPLGGLLSQPQLQYPGWFAGQSPWIRDLLTEQPYALPCMAVGAINLLTFLAAFVALPETKKENGLESNEVVLASDLGVWSVLKKQPSLQLACMQSLVFGAGIAAYDQLVPVWARNQLQFSPKELGTVQSVSGFVSCVASFFLITRLEASFGLGSAVKISLAIVLVGYITPLFDILVGMQSVTAASWVFLAVSYGFKALGIESCFCGITLLLKDCVPDEYFGVAQGIGASSLNMGLALGPFWGPPLFGLCTRLGGVLGGAVPFGVLGLIQVAAFVLTSSLMTRLSSELDLKEPILGNANRD